MSSSSRTCTVTPNAGCTAPFSSSQLTVPCTVMFPVGETALDCRGVSPAIRKGVATSTPPGKPGAPWS